MAVGTIAGEVGPDIFDGDLCGRNADAQVPRVMDHVPVDVLAAEIAAIGIGGIARLGAFLVDSAVQLLLDENVIVPVKVDGDVCCYLVYRG